MADIDRLNIEIDANTDKAVSALGKLDSALSGLQSHLSSGLGIGSVTAQMQNLSNVATDASSKLGGKASSGIRAISKAMKDMGKAVGSEGGGGLGGGLKKLISAFNRVLRYRILRSVIREIAQAFRTGVNNVVLYSQALRGLDANNANGAMSALASTALKVKNSLGTALIPVLWSIMPAIKTVANWFIIAANAINQFFSALRGNTTFTKAKDVTVDYAEGLSSAAGAAKELKDATIGLDELNVISPPDNGGGGAGGGGMPDASEMFEEADIDSKISKFAEKIKGILDWVKDHLDIIKGLAIAIGAALLAWEISSGLAKFIKSFTGTLKTILGWILIIAGAAALVTGALDAWNNGVDWTNLTMMLGGLAALATGLLIVFGPVAAAIGLLVGGIALLVIGIRDWIKQGELSTQTFWLLEGAIAAVGIALAILVSPWALVVAAAIGAGLAIYKYWDEIKQFFINLWEKIKEGFSELWENIKNIWGTVSDWFKQKVIDPVVNFFAPIKETISKIFEGCWILIRAVWVVVSNWFNETVIQPIIKFFAPIVEKVLGFFSVTWEKIKAVWTIASTWFDQTVIQPLVGYFLTAWDTIKTGFESAFEGIKKIAKTIINGIIGMVEGIINRIIRGINKLLDGFNSVVSWGAKVIGVDWSGLTLLKEVTLPRLAANGGTFQTGEMFIAREAGPEMVGTIGGSTAVANNDQIVSAVASGVYTAVMNAFAESGANGGEASFNIYLDGKQIEASVRKTQQRRGATIANGGILNYAY